MLKLERTSVMNLENAMRGARNPMNSWGRMDSFYDGGTDLDRCVFRSGANAVSVDHQRDLYLRAHPSGGVVVLCDGT